MKVTKRDGRLEDYNSEKILIAIIKANEDLDEKNQINSKGLAGIWLSVNSEIRKYENDVIHIETIQDLIENKLMSVSPLLAKKYIIYRFERQLLRDKKKRNKGIFELLKGENQELHKENSNKNDKLISTQRDYIAGEVSKELCREFIYPKKLIKAHDEGLIHIHDMDYVSMSLHNCCLINLEDMLQNGTVINKTLIETPQSFSTACTIATQIILQVVSNQFGGATMSLTHLAPFVRKSYEKYISKYKKYNYDFDLALTNEKIEQMALLDLKKEIKSGVQTIQYQLNTMNSTNGQSPFITIFMYLNETQEYQKELAMIIEEVLNQRIEGVKNEKGINITTAFPKIIYCLDENNIHLDSEYYYLTELSVACSAKRLVPDYISAKKMKELKEGNVFPAMGCRSFLQPYTDENGNPKYYGRYNQGVCTVNLVDIALSSKGDMQEFWNIFNERTNLCYEALMIRHKTLLGTPSDVAPILWQHGVLARLEQGETIDKTLYNDYSSISLGYAGLYECVKYMTGKSHTEEGGFEFAKVIMQSLNDKCAKWKEATNIGFSIYGTPIESTTLKFSNGLKKRFGVVEGITDKNYITNSYHVNVTEDIDAFSKLKIESQFQELSLGGSISYVETPNMEKNIEALMEVVKFIYLNNMYAEINTKSSYCHDCGFTDLQIDRETWDWYCPQCGNTNHDKMNVAVRVCGYISTNPFNEGRANDIADRVYHIGKD